MHSECKFRIVANMRYFQCFMIRLLGDVRIKYGFFITRRYLEKVPKCVNVAHQYFVHKCYLQVLRFDLKLKYLMFKLYFSY